MHNIKSFKNKAKVLICTLGLTLTLVFSLSASTSAIFVNGGGPKTNSTPSSSGTSTNNGSGSGSGSNSNNNTNTSGCPQSQGTCSDCASSSNSTGADASGNCVQCDKGNCGDASANPNQPCTEQSCDFVHKYINPFINLLSILVGLVVVISVIIAAINYITSEGDPQKASNAKRRIVNAVIAFLGFAVLYTFLQFLIPGGIFNS